MMNIEQFSLENQVAIITGCSTGLGQAIAIALSKAGAKVVGVDYVEAEETKEIIEGLGNEFLAIKANLLTTEPIDGIIEETVKAFGKVDILVNNAGIIRRNDVLEFSEKDWDDVLNINLKTVFFFSQAVSKQFVKQDTRGKIINIASMLSFQGGIRVPSYTASKSGIMGITKALANELASKNININAIAPGYMATNNTAPLRADKERSKAILDRIPENRWGLPEDVAWPVVFLASNASNYINGYTLAVDGGWLAR